jgi:hypothetical protein
MDSRNLFSKHIGKQTKTLANSDLGPTKVFSPEKSSLGHHKQHVNRGWTPSTTTVPLRHRWEP